MAQSDKIMTEISIDDDKPRSQATEPGARVPGWQDILINSICLTLPMTLLTVVLLTCVYKYQFKPGYEGSSVFSHGPNVPDDNAIYVDVDSTTLIFLASWMSSLAPLLIGSAIALITYPVAQDLLKDTMIASRRQYLPTSFQLSLIPRLISGSTWGSLWGVLQYDAVWKNRAERRATALVSLMAATLVAVGLSTVVFGADTWLHLATKTVTLMQPLPLPNHDILHSFALLPACTVTNNSFSALQQKNLSCTLDGSFPQAVFNDPITTIETINNQSESRSILRIGDSNLSYLSPSFKSLDSKLDFIASTYAVRTICEPISRACNLASNFNITLNCSDGAFAYEGNDLGQLAYAAQVFKLPDISDQDDPKQFYGVQNPFYVAAASENSTPSKSALRNDPEFVPIARGVVGVFSCSVTIYDIEYAYSQNIARTLNITQSNASVANVFASGIASQPFGRASMMASLNVAAIEATTARDFADTLAISLSSTVLSSGAGSVRATPAHLAQQRKPILVSRVPIPPFYLLVGVNFAIVLLGAVISFMASMTPWEGRQAQYRLTITGIVANLFERENAGRETTSIEQLFGEYHGANESFRVGMDRTSKGGFVFSTVTLSPPDVQAHDDPTGSPSQNANDTYLSLPGDNGCEQPKSLDETLINYFDRRSWA